MNMTSSGPRQVEDDKKRNKRLQILDLSDSNKCLDKLRSRENLLIFEYVSQHLTDIHDN